MTIHYGAGNCLLCDDYTKALKREENDTSLAVNHAHVQFETSHSAVSKR